MNPLNDQTIYCSFSLPKAKKGVPLLPGTLASANFRDFFTEQLHFCPLLSDVHYVRSFSQFLLL